MREPIHTDEAPKAGGPYSQAVKIYGREILFCSGQLPLDPVTGDVVDGLPAAQAEQAMKNLGAVVKAGGFDMGDVVKTTLYVTNLAVMADINSVYESFFKDSFPARSTVQVSALPQNALLEIDAVACR